MYITVVAFESKYWTVISPAPTWVQPKIASNFRKMLDRTYTNGILQSAASVSIELNADYSPNLLNMYTNSKIMNAFSEIPERRMKETKKAKAAEGGEECDCGSAPQGDFGIACLKPSHQWAGSLGS